jgi:hypothetical protein
MKKRNKKFNHVKAATIVAQQALKNLAVAKVVNDSNDQPIALINMKGDKLGITHGIASAISDFRFKWSIYLVIGTTSRRNNKELKIDHVPCAEPYLQSELVGYLNKRHQDFIADLVSKNVRMDFAGWIAKPSGREIEPEELFDIFYNLGAWDE